jgi:xanthine dehydrogenase YagS FAD-binding subunit
MTVLKSQEMVTEVFVPTQPKSAKGTYLKAMERKVWSFALASVAAQLRFNGPSVAEARVVLGGVATRPWRARGAERALPGRRLESDTVEEVAEVAVEEAQSLSNNSYKIRLVKGLVRQALGALRPTI